MHLTLGTVFHHALLFGRCRAVVSHGGAGTLLGGFGHELTQLLLPQGADQFDNAQAAERTGAALSLTPEAVTPEAVTAAARRLLEEPSFAAAARSIQAEIEAMPPAADVLADLLADEALALALARTNSA